MVFRKQQLDFEEVDRRYDELKRLFEAGDITEEDFDAQLRQLMVQDEEGRWWAKSRRSGEWHYYDGIAWFRGTPPGGRPTPRATPSTEERVSEYQPQCEGQGAWWRRKEVLGAIAIVFAGATWIVWALIIAVVSAPAPLTLYLGAFALTQVGTLVGLMGLRMQQGASYRVLATAGFLLASISIAFLLISTVIYLIAPDVIDRIPEWLLYFSMDFYGLGTLDLYL
jgi:hypothetical protein